jgi:2-iminobutanoate/2-iminopropanoate deaminase
VNPLKIIRTDKAPAAIGPYSQAVLDPATGILYCSGQIGIDPATGELAPGGVEAETRQVLRNIQALLQTAGGSLADVVRVVLYLAEMKDFGVVNPVYAEVFREPFPARSTIQAAGLPKGARLEVEVTAVVRDVRQEALGGIRH